MVILIVFQVHGKRLRIKIEGDKKRRNERGRDMKKISFKS
jgi:hypothetical protein